MNDNLHPRSELVQPTDGRLDAIEPEPVAAGVADGVDVGLGDAHLTRRTVRQIVATRRRRRNVAFGVVSACTLVMSIVVIASIIKGPDKGSSTTTYSNDSTETVPSTAVEPPVPTAPPIRVVPVPSTGQVVTDPGISAYGTAQWPVKLFGWNGGFLAIRSMRDSQPLPEFSPDFVDQFPQEVIDLFADRSPATVEEATAILKEAGLLEEVYEIVGSDWNVSDAVSSVEPPLTTTARFSPDGIEWSDIAATFPDDIDLDTLTVAGDQLVATNGASSEDHDGGEPPTSIDVYFTTDLVRWTRQAAKAPERPADLPAFVDFTWYTGTFAANADRWMLTVDTYTAVDLLALVGPEFRAELVGLESDVVTISNEEGIVVTVQYGMDESPSTKYRFTWEELGIDDEESMWDFETRSTLVWTSDGNDQPVVLTPSGSALGLDGRFGDPLAIDGGFVVRLDGKLAFSIDGSAWSAADTPGGDNRYPLLPLGSTVVAFTNNGDERRQYQLDTATMTWSALEISGFTNAFFVDKVGHGAVVLDEAGDEPNLGGVTTVRMTNEANGFRLELSAGVAEQSDVSYTVIEVATGRVVSSETIVGSSGDSRFEFLKANEDNGLGVLDPESGNELFVVPFNEISFERLGPDGEVIADDDAGSSTDTETIGQWIIATDGTTWLLEHAITEPVEQDRDGFSDVVSSNGVVLAVKYDGTFVRYELS
jgi:hypothetical protein